MASKSLISVSVWEGDFAKLRSGGVPISASVCIHLQEKGLHFNNAVWTTKQSRTGFSVSFFWECGSQVNAKKKCRKRKMKPCSKRPDV